MNPPVHFNLPLETTGVTINTIFLIIKTLFIQPKRVIKKHLVSLNAGNFLLFRILIDPPERLHPNPSG